MTNRSLLSIPLPLRLSGSALKVIAVLSMVLDHWAYFLIDSITPLYSVMRCFGRIAFPVFAFLIAEGFAHTGSRMRYFLTILGFGFISDIPWMLLNGNDGTHNVMFTLALGVAALALFDRLHEHGPICFVGMLMMCGIGYILHSDYDWRGVMMIVLFYMLRTQTIQPWKDRFRINYFSQAFLQILFAFPLMAYYGVAGAMFSSLIIFLYDGSKGSLRGSTSKYAFYCFYPLHLLVFKALL